MTTVFHPPRVTYDLLRPIFENLDKESLFVVSLASSSFRDEAQRILFREVIGLYMYTSHIKFLRTVAASPTRLALFVYAYRHSWTISYPHDQELANIMSDVVGPAFKSMRCLKQLEIRLYPEISCNRDDYIQALSECTFSLECLNWWDHGGIADGLVERFLSRQPTLKHLGCNMIWNDALRVVPLTTCPQLVSLTAGLSMIQAFLPGHKISILSFVLVDTGITDGDVKSLAVELKSVKALSITFRGLMETEVRGRGILRYFTILNVLEIYSFDNSIYYQQNSYTQLEALQILNLQSKLPTIQKLILTHMGGTNRYLDKDIEFMRRLFSNAGHHRECIDVRTSYRSLYAHCL